MAERKRFKEFTDEEVTAKRLKVQKKNTLKSNLSTTNQLQAFLGQLSENTDFWTFLPEKLDNILGRFWFSARQTKTDKEGNEKKYTVQSLHSLRYGLKRVLKEKKYPHNIITSDLFSNSQQLFEDACRELKSEGLGSVQHYPEIKPSGKKTIFCTTSNNQSDYKFYIQVDNILINRNIKKNQHVQQANFLLKCLKVVRNN